MSIDIRDDSLYKFASAYYDEAQGEYVWGIADPPDALAREDDQFYIMRESDRFDLIANQMLGDPHHYWIILHYNNIPSALNPSSYIGKELRIPSKATLERIYLNADERSNSSTDNS